MEKQLQVVDQLRSMLPSGRFWSSASAGANLVFMLAPF